MHLCSGGKIKTTEPPTFTELLLCANCWVKPGVRPPLQSSRWPCAVSALLGHYCPKERESQPGEVSCPRQTRRASGGARIQTRDV